MPEHPINKAIHRLEYVNPFDPQPYRTRDVLAIVADLLAGINPELPLNSDVQRDVALAHSALERARRYACKEVEKYEQARTVALVEAALEPIPLHDPARCPACRAEGWTSVHS